MPSTPLRHPLVSFTADEEGRVEVRDELASDLMVLQTTPPPELEPALTELFYFPVDNAASFPTAELHIPRLHSALLRDETGTHLGEFTSTPREVNGGTYYVEIEAGVKAYVRIDGASFSAVNRSIDSVGQLHITFDEPTRVVVGARSLHRRPQATITVPDDPVAMMEAVSSLGSAIKEFTVERSWPTLRGHPPAIERGDRLDVPDELAKPDTGVHVTVPANYASVYRVAPLAFYLGASVEDGQTPELHLDTGFVEPLVTPSRTLEQSVDRILGTALVLDSLVRIGGYYSFPRYEYETLAPDLPFYPPNLYDRSLSEQLMEYLEVPFADIEPYLPRRPMIAVLRPRPDDVAYLPYLLDSLAHVHVASTPPTEPADEAGPTPIVRSVPATTHETLPVGTTRLTTTAFENALNFAPTSPGETRFVFVMASEERAARFRERLDETGKTTLAAVTTTVVGPPTRQTLRALVERDTAFLHCEVPVSEAGFACVDGPLPPEDLADVGAATVSLVGDAGLDAGTALVEAGAVAGFTAANALSLDRVQWLAGHLADGYPFAAAVELSGVTATTPHWHVGDPTRTLTHDVGWGAPALVEITSVATDEHLLSVFAFPTNLFRAGSAARFTRVFMFDYQLNGTTIPWTDRLSTSEVVSVLRRDEAAVLNGEIYHGERKPTEAFVRASARRALEDLT